MSGHTGFNMMVFFYGAMAAVPILMWIIAVSSPFPATLALRQVLGFLVAIGSITFGVIGFKEVFPSRRGG